MSKLYTLNSNKFQNNFIFSRETDTAMSNFDRFFYSKILDFNDTHQQKIIFNPGWNWNTHKNLRNANVHKSRRENWIFPFQTHQNSLSKLSFRLERHDISDQTAFSTLFDWLICFLIFTKNSFLHTWLNKTSHLKFYFFQL